MHESDSESDDQEEVKTWMEMEDLSQQKKVHMSAFSMMFHSSENGKKKTQQILDQYYKDKKDKEEEQKKKLERRRYQQEQMNIERSKAIFVVRTLEPKKGTAKSTGAKQISKEFMTQSDILELHRSRALDLQHLQLAEQEKRDKKRKKKKEYLVHKKEKVRKI